MKRRGAAKTSHELPPGEKSRRKNKRRTLTVHQGLKEKMIPVCDKNGSDVMATAVSLKFGGQLKPATLLLTFDSKDYRLFFSTDNKHIDFITKGRSRRGVLRKALFGR